MPIVTTFSSAYAKATGGVAAVPVEDKFHSGRQRAAGLTVSNAASDSNGSKYFLIRLPSNVILLPQTTFDIQDWGYAKCQVGVDGALTGLVDIDDVPALSAVSRPIVFADAKWNKPFWQQMGLSADPLGELDLYINTEANATGAGTADYGIYWIADF